MPFSRRLAQRKDLPARVAVFDRIERDLIIVGRRA